MAERYNKLYNLPGNLYAAGSPVVICAGALLKDNQGGKMLAQLKFRNISQHTISALKVQVLGFDVSGEKVCSVEHQYLDIKVGRNGVFGAKEAIPLPEQSVRSYQVRVLAAFFVEASPYIADDEQLWEVLPGQQPLRSKLFDRELIRQYKLDTTEKSEFVPLEYKDRWLCACGEINSPEEDCVSCGMSLDELKFRLNPEMLIEEKNQRLTEEAKAAAAKENSRERSAKILKIALMIIIPLMIICVGALFVLDRVNQREQDYLSAEELYNAGSYAEAAKAYDALGNYRDAQTKADAARAVLSETNSYEKGKKFLENGRWDDAYNAFEAMGDYQDAPELKNEALYLKAKDLISQGELSAAQELFEQLGQYKDSAQLAQCFVEVLCQTEASYNAECEGPLTCSYEYDAKGQLLKKTEHFSAYQGLYDRVLEYVWNGDGSYTETEGKTVRQYDVWGICVSENGESRYHIEYAYHDSGKLKAVMYYAEDGSVAGGTMYDEQGNPIAYLYTGGNTSTISNEYDAQGRLVKQESFDSSGAFVDRTSYEYDEQGRIKRSTYMNLENVTIVTNYSYTTIYAPEIEK